MNTLNIALAADENYKEYTTVAICSILENNKQNKINFYILYNKLKKNTIEKIKEVCRRYKNNKVNFIKVYKKMLPNYYISGHITITAYYRILIPKLIPKKKILYLDSDIIVKKDLSKLYNTKLNKYIIAAVEHPWSNKEKERLYSYLNIPLHKKYFNSGVLLINTQKWRKNKITEEVLKYIKEKKQLRSWDQDALIGVLYNNWKRLKLHFNQQIVYYTDDKKYLPQKELEQAIKDPTIIHYTGKYKPDSYICDHKYKKEYSKYYEMAYNKPCIYKNKNITGILIKIKNNIKKTLRKILPAFIIEIYRKYNYKTK
jgi:lipopolysaccharide biosynthesis glycosyltransferase